MPPGRVLDIQRFSLHDGPGIRTTVFLQGCPLRCWWCHNPESQAARGSLQVDAARCVRCGTCAAACPEPPSDALPHMPERCRACGACVDACPTGGRDLTGRPMAVDEVVEAAAADTDYYAASGGGVTLSGGEPLLQPEFTVAVLGACRERGWHTALDTCGHAPWRHLQAAAALADLVLYDVKSVDDEAHRRHTGVGTGLILENLQRLAGVHACIWVRVPVVPGANDTGAAMRALGATLRGLEPVRRVDLLPYHPMGRDKAGASAGPTPEPPSRASVEALAEVLRREGLQVHVGG